jgi:hypothetical protein
MINEIIKYNDYQIQVPIINSIKYKITSPVILKQTDIMEIKKINTEKLLDLNKHPRPSNFEEFI